MASKSAPPRAPGVFFIGAGPGDAGLLTLRGAALLARVDIVLHDAHVHPDVLARSHAERVIVGEGGDAGLQRPDEIARRLVELARAGRVVARLAASDPYLFSSGDEEVAIVSRAGVAFEVVPGIVGSVAAGAFAGLPLSRRADASPSVALADTRAGLALHDWSKLADATDTLTVLVPSGDVLELVRTLVFYGRLPTTPAAIIVDVARTTQEVIVGTLEDIASRGAKVGDRLVRLVVGEVAARREPLRWFDKRPLFGKRVLVTRSRDQAEGTADLLRERGAEPVVVPTIELRPPSDPEPMQKALAELGTYDWVAFTSANGVERAWAELRRSGRDARAFGNVKIAVIGPATGRALEAHGLSADVVAKEFKGEGLADELLRVVETKGARVLVLRALRAREALPEALRAAGCVVDVAPVYETHPPDGAAEALLEALTPGASEKGPRPVDAVLFTSTSTVDNLCDLLGPSAAALLARTRVGSIGPVTTQAAERRGVRVDVTADPYTLPALVDALERIFG